jgi:quercetin dioxygenase-like cupin family protein
MTAARTAPGRHGLAIHRAESAPLLFDTDFLRLPEPAAGAQAAPDTPSDEAAAAGAEVRVLLRQPLDEGGFSLVHAWFKGHYPVPRHTHDADCLYYVISGSLVMGSQTLRAGDVFFVPANAPYQYDAGPDGVEVLEIRHDVLSTDIDVLEASTARWQAMAATMAEHLPAWKAETVSPTLAANRAGR